ncbi:5'-deoxynucleotidase YfbR-like HD superfamily hydrolase [Arthrobacter sp. UYCu712]
MPHSLMSNESLTTDMPHPTPSAVTRLQDYRRAHEVGADLEPLRRQVSAIIDEILADTAPEDAEVREKLRRHVYANPGRPEKALLGHLHSMSARRDEAG